MMVYEEQAYVLGLNAKEGRHRWCMNHLGEEHLCHTRKESIGSTADLRGRPEVKDNSFIPQVS